MLFLNIYILLNIFVAIGTISAARNYENATADVPIGDLEFYEKPNPIWVWVLFPIAFLIYKAWSLFCQVMNAIL